MDGLREPGATTLKNSRRCRRCHPRTRRDLELAAVHFFNDPTTHLCSGFDRAPVAPGAASIGWKPKWLASAISTGGNCVRTFGPQSPRPKPVSIDTNHANKGNITTVARLMVTSVPATMKKIVVAVRVRDAVGVSCGAGSVRHAHRRRHHVVEVGHDPDRAGDDEKDDQHTEGKSQNIVRAIGPEADMKKEDEVDANLR
jgi:hypothetical protein